jgi:hypothetical protein
MYSKSQSVSSDLLHMSSENIATVVKMFRDCSRDCTGTFYTLL